MDVPSKDQLFDFVGLDDRYVVKHFNGKSVGDAYRMFADKPSLYCEDITYMSVAALDDYLPAALAYLSSPDSIRDWDRDSGVLTSLPGVIDNDLTPSVCATIRSIADYVAVDDGVPTRITAVCDSLLKLDGA